jgi:hypothetical protein
MHSTFLSSRLLSVLYEAVPPLLCFCPSGEVHIGHVLIIVQERLQLLHSNIHIATHDACLLQGCEC